ncbi:DEKNAAC104182 [Brettanomyces naardenensis]|uniref:Dihydroxyacetone kinase n=1 Tax=Brettanomyces naardenensis TaxID=13370 RepID=A0A448YPP1_BRENA|nr:DEKNAAC104182 [Brettanomyces naardenensis]
MTKHWQYSDDLLLNSLQGLANSNPDLNYLESERLVYRPASPDKVIILSGGGAGHEPLHAGFVGKGCIDVAVSGEIFASPSVKQIYSGLKVNQSEKGTLIVVKNYTGDVLHFGMAAERITAEDYPNRILIVQDDVAVGRTKNGLVGRRALAGTCFVHKVVGAKSEMEHHKATLDDVYDIGKRVNESLVTIGASLDRVEIPRVGKQSDSSASSIAPLSSNEAEIGMGIHNEPGIHRHSPVPEIRDLVHSLLAYLLSPADKERHYVEFNYGDEIALLVNNLGGTSNLELYAIQNFVVESLEKTYHISPSRIYTGTMTTSLDGPGFSITLLNITKAGGEEIKDCLDYPTEAPGWNSHLTRNKWEREREDDEEPNYDIELPTSLVTFEPAEYKKVLVEGCKALISKEAKLTEYDTIAGDGDCGITMARGGNSILKVIDNGELELVDAVRSLAQIADILETEMGGTSGGLYSIFVSGMVSSLKEQEKKKEGGKGFKVDKRVLSKTLKDALGTLEKYTRARVGDRTLMDALIPFVEKFEETADVEEAAKAAIAGAEKTRKMEAKFGRASYVGKEEFERYEAEGGVPDAGAIGLAGLIAGMANE